MKIKNIMDDIKDLEEYAKICQVTWGDKKLMKNLKRIPRKKLKEF